jgi:hypothetical protein
MMLRNLAVAASLAFIGAALVLDGASLPRAAADCATGNLAEIELDGEVNVQADTGNFAFGLLGKWWLESNPAWVTIQLASTGSANVTNVVYYPPYLQNQNCIEEDGASFSVTGTLQEEEEDGNVNTRFDAGVAPDHDFDILATYIPAP